MNGTINELILDPKPKVSGNIKTQSQTQKEVQLDLIKSEKFRPHQEKQYEPKNNFKRVFFIIKDPF